jgi:diguanylate cyclase (GGDEF)-like protein
MGTRSRPSNKFLSRLRRRAVLLFSVMLVAGLGTVAAIENSSANREASGVHEHDRAQATQILASLTAQYLRFTALELSGYAASERWSLAPASPRDERLLNAFLEASPLLNQGAALMSLNGRPLALAAKPPGLPALTNPGYLPLYAALRSGTFGLSDVMRVGSTPLVAFGVPVLVHGSPRAILVGFANARSWPLEEYTRTTVRFGPTAVSMLADPNGVIAAAASPGLVGKRLPFAVTAVRRGGAGLIHFRMADKPYLANYDSTGVAGWVHIDEQQAADFSGPLDRHANAVWVALMALLVAALALVLLLAYKRNQALRQLADEALYDPLTGLHSRRLFDVRLQAAIARQRRTGANLAVAFCDVDGFKQINDRYGHTIGDAVLRQVAQRLRESLRAEDSIARFGGDEFVLLLEDIDDAAALAVVFADIGRRVSGPVAIGATRIQVSLSTGGVLHPPGALATPEEIVHLADVEMYRAKSDHGLCIAILDHPVGEGQGEPDGSPQAPSSTLAAPRSD